MGFNMFQIFVSDLQFSSDFSLRTHVECVLSVHPQTIGPSEIVSCSVSILLLVGAVVDRTCVSYTIQTDVRPDSEKTGFYSHICNARMVNNTQDCSFIQRVIYSD